MKIAVAAALLALLLAFAAHAGPLYAPLVRGNAMCPTAHISPGPSRIAWRPVCCAAAAHGHCAVPLAIGRGLAPPPSSGLHG